MSTPMKRSLTALLVAAAVVLPSTADAKGGKDGRGEHEAGEQSRGGGDDTRGGGNRHREERHVQEVQPQRDYAPRPSAAFEARGDGHGKRARREGHAAAEAFAVAGRRQNRQSARIARWKDHRSKEIRQERSQPRPFFEERQVGQRQFTRKDDQRSKPDRKFQKQLAKQQRAVVRAEAKQERRWVKQQRQAFKQASKVERVVAYDRSFADSDRPVRNDAVPLYRVPEVTSYRTYPSAYDYSPRYLTNDAYGYAGSYYPLGYSASPAYWPYDIAYGDVGYDDAGLGGLFGGGGGGLGDILVTLLPLLLGDALGFGGFGTDPLGAGLLGGYATPDFAGGYEPYYEPALGYSAPLYSDPYQDAYFDDGMLGNGGSLLGGDSLMSLVELALASGLLGGDQGGLGGLGGLLGVGGGLGLDGGLGVADPVYAYADPYSNSGGLLAGLGI